MTVRIKICGITRPEDARAATELGADAIGLVFAPASPRRVTIDQALEICRILPPFVTRVGLFMDPTAEEVHAVLKAVPLDCLQFHGSESAEYCAAFQRPWIKAIAMGGQLVQSLSECLMHELTPTYDLSTMYPEASALLVDSHAPGQAGGTGQRFDWNAFIPPDRPWVLAGGLNPENVAETCKLLSPPALDVSSGVESAPGIKDPALMEAFIRRARAGV